MGSGNGAASGSIGLLSGSDGPLPRRSIARPKTWLSSSWMEGRTMRIMSSAAWTVLATSLHSSLGFMGGRRGVCAGARCMIWMWLSTARTCAMMHVSGHGSERTACTYGPRRIRRSNAFEFMKQGRSCAAFASFPAASPPSILTPAAAATMDFRSKPEIPAPEIGPPEGGGEEGDAAKKLQAPLKRMAVKCPSMPSSSSSGSIRRISIPPRRMRSGHIQVTDSASASG
mmetsp:Transcript_27499/g.50735  ORF Transcript_27499/g.50735 Transcript_27499/m.50735 type:complete len:228 (-) Transcript_27499:1157-1840(-)